MKIHVLIRCFALYTGAVLAAFSLSYGATTNEIVLMNPPTVITPEQAVHIAKKEIARRNLPIDKDYITKISDSLVAIEFGDQYPIYLATISRKVGGKDVAVYKVGINKTSGKIEDFTDLRVSIPAKIKQ